MFGILTFALTASNGQDSSKPTPPFMLGRAIDITQLDLWSMSYPPGMEQDLFRGGCDIKRAACCRYVEEYGYEGTDWSGNIQWGSTPEKYKDWYIHNDCDREIGLPSGTNFYEKPSNCPYTCPDVDVVRAGCCLAGDEDTKLTFEPPATFDAPAGIGRCSTSKFGINFCDDWCNNNWGCGGGTLKANDTRNTDNVDYICHCEDCNGCDGASLKPTSAPTSAPSAKPTSTPTSSPTKTRYNLWNCNEILNGDYDTKCNNYTPDSGTDDNWSMPDKCWSGESTCTGTSSADLRHFENSEQAGSIVSKAAGVYSQISAKGVDFTLNTIFSKSTNLKKTNSIAGVFGHDIQTNNCYSMLATCWQSGGYLATDILHSLKSLPTDAAGKSPGVLSVWIDNVVSKAGTHLVVGTTNGAAVKYVWYTDDTSKTAVNCLDEKICASFVYKIPAKGDSDKPGDKPVDVDGNGDKKDLCKNNNNHCSNSTSSSAMFENNCQALGGTAKSRAGVCTGTGKGYKIDTNLLKDHLEAGGSSQAAVIEMTLMRLDKVVERMELDPSKHEIAPTLEMAIDYHLCTSRNKIANKHSGWKWNTSGSKGYCENTCDRICVHGTLDKSTCTCNCLKNSEGGWKGDSCETEYGNVAYSTIELHDGSQLFADSDGWVQVLKEGQGANTDPARREWAYFKPHLRLRDGRTLYSTGGWAAVSHSHPYNVWFDPHAGTWTVGDNQYLYSTAGDRWGWGAWEHNGVATNTDADRRTWKFGKSMLMCAPGCPSAWIGNGHCDDYCNVPACNYDCEDCGSKSPAHPKCPATAFHAPEPHPAVEFGSSAIKDWAMENGLTVAPSVAPSVAPTESPTKVPTDEERLTEPAKGAFESSFGKVGNLMDRLGEFLTHEGFRR